MRSCFRVSIAGLMALVFTDALCLAALRYPGVAVGVLLVFMALLYLALLLLAPGGVVVLARRLARRAIRLGVRARRTRDALPPGGGR